MDYECDSKKQNSKEILLDSIDINKNKISNEFYRMWMNEKSNISKAIFHLSKASEYLLIWNELEENNYKEHAYKIENFHNEISYIQKELTDYVDRNIDILDKEKKLKIKE